MNTENSIKAIDKKNYIAAINKLLLKCYDLALFDLILQLLRKSL